MLSYGPSEPYVSNMSYTEKCQSYVYVSVIPPPLTHEVTFSILRCMFIIKLYLPFDKEMIMAYASLSPKHATPTL